MSLYIGIDPGASGGITVIDGVSVTVHPMPDTEAGIWSLLGSYRDTTAVVVIERVGGYVAGNPTPGSAMFNFGSNYGGLRMALVAAGVPFVAVVPQRWQAAFGIGRPRDEKEYAFKSRLVARARELFPRVKINRDPADSVLLCEYCRRHAAQLFPRVG